VQQGNPLEVVDRLNNVTAPVNRVALPTVSTRTSADSKDFVATTLKMLEKEQDMGTTVSKGLWIEAGFKSSLGTTSGHRFT